MNLSNLITCIIPTSLIPSHPSTEVITETIGRIRSYPELAQCAIYVMADGLRPEQESRRADYNQYLAALDYIVRKVPTQPYSMLMKFEQHSHQSQMMIRAIDYVRTPLLFFVEHDTWPYGIIDFAGICKACLSDEVDVIRLHINHRILPEHEYLFEDLTPRMVQGVPLCRTRMWSQRPHIAKTEWYRRVLKDHFTPSDLCMIEDALLGKVCYSPWEKYRVAIYAPDGNMTHSGHSNARAGDVKHIGVYEGKILL